MSISFSGIIPRCIRNKISLDLDPLFLLPGMRSHLCSMGRSRFLFTLADLGQAVAHRFLNTGTVLQALIANLTGVPKPEIAYILLQRCGPRTGFTACFFSHETMGRAQCKNETQGGSFKESTSTFFRDSIRSALSAPNPIP